MIPRLFRAARICALLLAAGCSQIGGAKVPATELVAGPTVSAPRGMVVSASTIASETGRNVLAEGGNAVDAAIATGFALAVTYPVAGNIGGGGFMVIRFPDGRATTIDFREMAPQGASPTMFTDSAGNYSARIHHDSHRSVGVPGTVAGFELAHRKYGSARWSRLVDPAVQLAGNGFAAPPGLAQSLSWAIGNSFKEFPASVAAYSKSGQPYAAGETIRQPDLAKTLTRIRDQGRDGFYKGQTARLLATDMREHGGLITEDDLAKYEAKERAPIRGSYRGYEIISMPPPSSGGVALVEMLNILEGYPLQAAGHDSPRYVHLVTEAMRRAFIDRAKYLGDPDFTKVDVAHLTDKVYADDVRRTIMPGRASKSAPSDLALRHESDQTTHYSVVDANGMAVSVTYTLENGYGLGAVVPGAGFLLNNEMGDFNGKPGVTDTTGLIGTDPNVAMPGKRMLSSMTPTIVARQGKLVAVVGSPGGRTIINTVLQVILNQVDFKMGIREAVDAKRFHHQWLPDKLYVERDGLPPATVDSLAAIGHPITWTGAQGTAHSIRIDPVTGVRQGAADTRDKDAGAAGY
jgi:gamma-glutamyltranspeptidase/glutathione hydrolase